MSGNRLAALYWLSAAVTAARAYGLDVLDGVYNDFKDLEGFRRECAQGRALGFDGKTLIHPDQVAIANAVFAPPEAEVAFARKIIAAFEEPRNRGKRGDHRGRPHGGAAARRDGAPHRGHRRGDRSDGGVMSQGEAKARRGNYFEDFAVGQVLAHATPRTVTAGDVALYTGLYGPRFAVQSSDAFARAIGYPRAPVDDLLVFHVVFGKSVPDISLNAVANLGYAECRFLRPVYPGDTLSAASEVIGLRESSSRTSGIVYVRTTGRNQSGETVLDYVRWVMVRKRDPQSPAPAPVVPTPAERVDPSMLGTAVPEIDIGRYDLELAGAPHRWGDYAVGERIDHIDGMTLEEAEHQIATRLYQNTAKVHFNQLEQAAGPVQASPHLRRRGDLARPRALLQRPRQRLPHRGHQRRAACGALLRRRHGLRLVGGAGEGGARGPAAMSAPCACASWP